MKMKHVLVVDDEEAIVYIFRRYLEVAGFRVTTAGDGVEALEVFGRERIDALVTDARMPRMGGEELINRIRPVRPDMPIVVVSAYPTEIGKGSPGVRVFSKPVDAASLVAALADMLGDLETAGLDPVPGS
jgi:CheY-like chemotaxis protein